MFRSPSQAVKLKRQALGWSSIKLAAESGRAIEEIRQLESGDSNDDGLAAALITLIDSAIVKVLPLWEQIICDPDLGADTGEGKAARKQRLLEFGKLLRDRRNRAQLSRLELAKLAGLSDATIKFIEVARHPPSRRTCQALVGVKDLELKWEDVAVLGYVGPEPAEAMTSPAMLPPHDSQASVTPAQTQPDCSPAADAPAIMMPERTSQSSSALVEQPGDVGEIIEEEIITHIRRTVRRR